MAAVSTERGEARRRRRLTNSIKESLRELNIQLVLLNHQISAQLGLKDVDLECYDLVSRYGPFSPTTLARQTGMHPATMTGILDRLERGGWITRERDPADRRAVIIRARRDRNAELFELLSGMNESMDDICRDYSESELELLSDFLRRSSKAGREATDELTGK